MIRRPPSSTLFPSPTLFRSLPADSDGRAADPVRAVAALVDDAGELAGVAGRSAPVDQRHVIGPVPAAPRVGVAAGVARREIGRAQSELQSPCNLVCRLLLEK